MVETVIKLISYTSSELDDYLQPIETRKETSVLAIEVPIGRTEFFSGGQAGILPEYEFLINPAEYSGEEEAEILVNGVTIGLSIYRIYERNADQLEIYCQRAAGYNRRAEA